MQIGRFIPASYEQLSATVATVGAVAPPNAPDAVKHPLDEHDHDTIVGEVPPAPTNEARALVDAAAERAAELHRLNRELHFTHDEDTNRVVIQVRDLEGNVLKTIPPSKALDVMSGADL